MEKFIELFIKFIWCISALLGIIFATLIFIPVSFYGITNDFSIKEIFIEYFEGVVEEIKRQWKTLKESF